MEDDKISESMRVAMESFFNMHAAAAEKNINKAATVFYSVVKRTYATAKEEDLFEKDKDEINTCLKGTQFMMQMMLVKEGWTTEMIQEFDDKVDKLWNVDGDDKC